MTRKSFQKGCLNWHNNQWTLLYWLKDHSTGEWHQKRESAAFMSYTDRKGKKAAREAAIEFLKPINELNSTTRPRQAVTFAQFIGTRWASYLAKRNLQESSLYLYQSIIKKQLLPYFGDDVLAEITTARVTDFFDSLGHLRPSTVENIFKVLNLIFDVAVEYDFITVTPLRKKLHKPEFERTKKPILPQEQARRLLRGLTYSHRLLFVVLSVLTIRINECLALRWQNLDLENGVVSLTHGLYRGRLKAKLKSKASRRKFELPSVLCEALKKFRAASPFNRDGDFVLCDVVGEAIDQSNFRRTVLYPLMDSLGIERGKNTHGFHLLRHTGATVLHELTGDIEISQRALGHASRSTTEIIYDHAEVVVGTETTGLLLDWLLGSDGELLERSDTVN